ncbi:peroxisomal acyl-coenzyme A oxidase 3-like, partial [Myotis lucifugus]|uniref:peroxisomal acyl-coenzyme A oxidase 3-like n=1 Tax=Myotis lucifugus TaxID=59463 RepID=UPI000CCC35FD
MLCYSSTGHLLDALLLEYWTPAGRSVTRVPDTCWALCYSSTGHLLGALLLEYWAPARCSVTRVLDTCWALCGHFFLFPSQVPLAAYEWLVCYLLRESHQKLTQEKRSGSSDFEARNNSQVYCCRSLALAFLELTVVRRFHEHTHQPDVPPPLRTVLRRLSALYGLWSLSQHTALLYRGGYFSGEQAGKMLEGAILELCSQLKDDAVALADVIAPPDFILDSPIGRADGE